MIELIFFNAEAVQRVALRIANALYNGDAQACSDTIWLDGAYIKFKEKTVTVNIFSSEKTLSKAIMDLIKSSLIGEEVYICCPPHRGDYVEYVNDTTNIGVAKNE